MRKCQHHSDQRQKCFTGNPGVTSVRCSGVRMDFSRAHSYHHDLNWTSSPKLFASKSKRPYRDSQGVVPACQAVDDVAGLAQVQLVADLVQQEREALDNEKHCVHSLLSLWQFSGWSTGINGFFILILTVNIFVPGQQNTFFPYNTIWGSNKKWWPGSG